MSDLAALGLSVNSEGVLAADAALDGFARSAAGASAGADKISASSQRSNKSVGELSNSVRAAEAAIAALSLAEGSGAQRALDLASSAQRASAGLDGIAGSAAASLSQIGRLAEGYDLLTGKVNGNFLAIGRNLQNIGALPGEVNKVTTSLKFGGVEALNFSRQLADIGVTAAMGMNPLMIALQQGPQLFDILQAKAVATGATIGAVAKAAGAQIWAAIAPLLPIIAAVALAAGTIAAAFALGTREINKGNQSVIDGLGLTEKQLERVKKKGTDTGVTIGDTFFAFFDVIGDRLTGAFDGPLKWLSDAWSSTLDFITTYGAKAIELIVGGFVGGVYAIKAAWKILPSAIGDIVISAANATLAGIEWMINKAVNGLNGLIDLANKAAAKVGMEGFDKLDNVKLGRQENPYAGQRDALGSAVSDGFSKGLSESKGMLGRFWGDVDKQARANARDRIKAAAGDAEKAAKTPKGPKTEGEKFGDLTGDIQRQIAMLKAQEEALALSEDAALLLTNQQKLLNDAQAKGIHVTEQQRQVLMGLADQLTEAQIALRKAQNLKAVNDGYEAQIRSIQQAGAQIGVYGKGLIELTTYQEMLNKATNNGKDAIDDLTDARLRGKAAAIAYAQSTNDNRKFIEGLIEDTEAMQRALEAERGEVGLTGAALYAYRYEQEALEKARKDHIDLTPAQIAAIKATGEAYGKTAADVANLASRLEALNGMMGHGTIGKLIGVLTSADPTTALLNMGGLGGVAGMFTKGGQEAYKKQAQIITDGIKSVFPEMSDKLAGTLGGALQGAGIGGAVGGSLFSKSEAGKFGATAGGALGAAAFKELAGPGLTKALGAFGGPLASIAGSIAGGLLGSLFKTTKKGYANLTSGLDGIDIANSGNSSSRIGTSNSLADALGSSLSKIADAFGGKLAAGINLGSLGVRDDKFTFDPTPGNKAGRVEYASAEEATRVALEYALSQGVITGIRDGTARILKSGKDLDAALQDALSFQSVFDQLDQIKDPTAYALKQLDTEFAHLRDVFAEAGASAEEYAQLEELLTIKRQQAMQKETDALDDVRSRIAEAQGDNETVKAIERAHEMRDAVSDQVRAELQRLYVIEDATEAQQALADAQAAAASAADQLRDTWKSIGNDLLDEINRIRGLTSAESGMGYAALQSQFNAALSLARMGDTDAAGKLADLSQSLISAAGDAAKSREELERVKGQTAAGLESVYRMSGYAPAAAATTASPFPTGALPVASMPGFTQNAQTTSEVRDILGALLQETSVTQRQQVQNGSTLNRLMSRLEATGFPVRTDDDTPLKVEVVA